jgi:hypothetical protein
VSFNERVEGRLNLAVDKMLGMLDLITQEEYSSKDNCMILYGKQDLQLVDKKFNLHGVWMINAPVHGENTSLAMAFLLLGHGKLIIGYPENKIVLVEDYSIDGRKKYDYAKYTSMDIVNSENTRKLDNIKTKSGADKKLESFRGPYDAKIKSVSVLGTEEIVISYRKWFFSDEKKLRKIPVAKR